VYACFGIFFISCLSKVTLILRHLWKTKFQGMLRPTGAISRLKRESSRCKSRIFECNGGILEQLNLRRMTDGRTTLIGRLFNVFHGSQRYMESLLVLDYVKKSNHIRLKAT
jgi:hypothetical protein